MCQYLNINILIKKILILIILIVTINLFSLGQSVIEVIDPVEADIVLLNVDKIEDADIVVYKTKKKRESKQWDCMWRFKLWGFSDLSLYIYSDINDTTKFYDEDLKYKIAGKVYFTQNIDERGYKNPYFSIEGLIRKSSIKDSVNLWVDVNKDSLQNVKKDTLNDSLVVEKTVPVDTLPMINEINNNIISNVVFKVQVGACHRQIPDAELHKRYPGNKKVSIEMHEGWYKYLIGNFSTYSEAKQEKISSGTADAWVVVYKDNERVSITEVVHLLSYYPLCKLLIYSLT